MTDGPVRQLNVLTANQQRCDAKGPAEWNRSTARVCRRTGACYAALHQYGRLEPQACKWQVRLGLTCRKHGEAHQYRGPLPAYCDACDAWFPLRLVYDSGRWGTVSALPHGGGAARGSRQRGGASAHIS